MLLGTPAKLQRTALLLSPERELLDLDVNVRQAVVYRRGDRDRAPARGLMPWASR
jgi:hypothetical protein